MILAACRTIPDQTKYAGIQNTSEDLPYRSGFSRAASRCLRDFITGEMAGGDWTLLEKPTGSTLTQEVLIGDNPCIDFDVVGCGLYRFKYRIGDICCLDSTTIRINKRCCNITGTIICN